MLRETYWLSRWRAAVEAWMPLKCWFKDLIKTPEISKEPSGNDFSLENVQSGQCPILAGRNLPYIFLHDLIGVAEYLAELAGWVSCKV